MLRLSHDASTGESSSTDALPPVAEALSKAVARTVRILTGSVDLTCAMMLPASARARQRPGRLEQRKRREDSQTGRTNSVPSAAILVTSEIIVVSILLTSFHQIDVWNRQLQTHSAETRGKESLATAVWPATR